jgi:ribosomal-protein-alanine N-acetyltransferase
MSQNDIPDVLEIESVSFSNPWRKQDFEYALREENGLCRVCRLKGLVVGYAVGFFSSHELHLADFAVRPECQRRGYGSALLGVFLEQLGELGAKIVTLEVRRSNQPAVGLYERAGFQTVAIRDAYYSRPREDALVMLKSLDGDLENWVPTVPGETLKTGESS